METHKRPKPDEEIARKRVKAKRKCLRCGDMFTSEWAGHRLCDRCNRCEE